MNFSPCALLLAAASTLFIFSNARAEMHVSILPDLKSPAGEISPNFCGLSYETRMLLPANDGSYFFSPSHAQLISLFKSLGVKSLRVGGNSADAPTVAIPADADLDNLFAFAKAADVHVIYNLRLKDQSDPASAIHIAKYITQHYPDRITCFTIGNEPNMYITQYPSYRAQWKKFADAIALAVPDAKFNGPSATPGKVAWSRDFANDFASFPNLALITQHSYPGGNAQKVVDAAAARELILSPEMDSGYQKFYDTFVPAAFKNHQRYRLEEANSLFHGGAGGVSNSCASALWGLDYMLWWATHSADGINFHTGNHVTGSESQIPGGYDISWTAPSGLKVHPIAYALKAFTFSSSGRVIPVKLVGAPSTANLTAYAVRAPDRSLIITVINRAIGADAETARLVIGSGNGFGEAAQLELTIPQHDVSQLTGVTLGGEEIAGDGAWSGHWKRIAHDPGYLLELPPASATVIKLSPLSVAPSAARKR